MENNPEESIFVTLPSLAPLNEYTELLQGVWDRQILTHNGPLVQQLEKELQNKLGVKNVTAVTNGTIALQLAIKALDLKGEIITTPFTWIATVSAIMWEQCIPVFVDIDPKTLNIDPHKIEHAINEKTCAILGVHVFSNPCDIEAIDTLAKKYDLKVIYDAAHAMCVRYKGKSILNYGDISATSFHATKIFNTGEGGACITTSSETDDRLKRLRFFGYDDSKEIVDEGCNGKMTEVHAALGLANLRHLGEVIHKRKQIFDIYYSCLKDLDFISFQTIDSTSYNYSYVPVLFDSEKRLKETMLILKQKNVFARRYFYPSLNTVKATGTHHSYLPHSEDVASRILCLPSYHSLELETVDRIGKIIKKRF